MLKIICVCSPKFIEWCSSLSVCCYKVGQEQKDKKNGNIEKSIGIAHSAH